MTKPVKIPEKLYYKAGDVCKIAGIQSYVLKYWETEFPQLASEKLEGGQKVYTRNDVELILQIKKLLYEDGFTISGAKKQLEKDEPEAPPAPPSPQVPLENPPALEVKHKAAFEEVLSELKALREKLAD
jgi:DNA-binding transcriptional MerR regulator